MNSFSPLTRSRPLQIRLPDKFVNNEAFNTLQKILVLLGNSFSDIFAEVQIRF